MQEINFPIFSDSIKKKYSKSASTHSNVLSKINTNREDLIGRHFKRGITVDDISSKDLDDGIWAFKHDYGYVVEVSIADVSEVVKFNSPLDIEALERCTSVYYNTHALFMLPDDITVNKLSLNNNTTRLTLTVTINLDLEFNVIDSFIEETLFHNMKRFCYKTFSESYYDTECSFNESLSIIHKIAIGLYSNRYQKVIYDDFKDDDRKLLLDMHKDDTVDGKRVIVNDNEELELVDIEVDLKKIPSFCIQEFMILSNKEVARFCSENKIPVTFRNHMPNEIGKKIKIQHMERAFYDGTMLGHYALGEEFYCHFTSPIRRYADLVLHRQIKFFLETGKLFYSHKNISELSSYITTKVHSIMDQQSKEEKVIAKKNNELVIAKLTRDINSDDISKLDFQSYEKLLKNYLIVGNDNIILPKELVDITHTYLQAKKRFSDDSIILMLFSINNLNLEEIFLFIDTKHHSYIRVMFNKYFKRGKFYYKLVHNSTRTSYTGSDSYISKIHQDSIFQKMKKQNRRKRFGYTKPNKYSVRLELYFASILILKQSSSSEDEKDSEVKAFSKFLRKIVLYYRNSDYNVIDQLIKAGGNSGFFIY